MKRAHTHTRWGTKIVGAPEEEGVLEEEVDGFDRWEAFYRVTDSDIRSKNPLLRVNCKCEKATETLKVSDVEFIGEHHSLWFRFEFLGLAHDFITFPPSSTYSKKFNI